MKSPNVLDLNLSTVHTGRYGRTMVHVRMLLDSIFKKNIRLPSY
eukprot:SAG31_NODE_1351_length_8676_cov_3.112044_8_plen_44_part_00